MLRNVDQRDVVGGGLLTVIGGFVSVYTWLHYDIGSVERMGPGMFPIVLGSLLIGLGIVVLVPGLSRSGSISEVRLRPFAAVVLATVSFAFSAGTVGMVPAIFLLTVLAALADRNLELLPALVLAAVLALFATVVFYYGLGVQLRLFSWPF